MSGIDDIYRALLAEVDRLSVCGNCGNADWTELYPLCLARDEKGSPSLQPWSNCAYVPSRWKQLPAVSGADYDPFDTGVKG